MPPDNKVQVRCAQLSVRLPRENCKAELYTRPGQLGVEVFFAAALHGLDSADWQQTKTCSDSRAICSRRYNKRFWLTPCEVSTILG
jgi:hypothetical protein